MVNFVTLIQLEYVYYNVGNAYCNAGNWNFDAKPSNYFPLKKTLLNMICASDDDQNIYKLY